MWLAQRDSYFRRADRLASALLLSGVGGARGARFRSGLGLGLALLDFATEALGREVYPMIQGWPRLPDYEILAPIYAHALGPQSQADTFAEGSLSIVAGAPCLRTTDIACVGGDLEAALAAARDAAWAAVGPRAEVALARSRRGGLQLQLRSLAGATRRSRQGDACVARLRPFLALCPQSALLAGEPGSGKTTAAAQVAAELGGDRSLRISVADLAAAPPSAIRAVVRLLQPGALLVDDLDRHPYPGALLDLFDEAGSFARLRLATCNYPRYLGAALVRPGRFDHHLRAEDDDVAAARRADAAAVLEPCAPALSPTELDEVLGWPIAFAARLALGVAARGSALASAEVGDLRRRLAEQRELEAPAPLAFDEFRKDSAPSP